jgi:phosphoribosylamine--glycine ligase
VEFNARFGDPETQPLLALLDSPLSPLLLGAATGALGEVPPPSFRPGSAVAVVLASAAYPESSSKGDVITGLEAAEALDDVHVIHAGTALSGDDLVTAGGRVLAVVGTGTSVADARDAAYRGVTEIRFEGAQHRTDIAAKVADHS